MSDSKEKIDPSCGKYYEELQENMKLDSELRCTYVKNNKVCRAHLYDHQHLPEGIAYTIFQKLTKNIFK